MAQYKLLPSYGEISSLNLEYEEAAPFSSFPLLDSHVEQGRGALEQHHQVRRRDPRHDIDVACKTSS